MRWPTPICSQVQSLKSGKSFLVIVVPNFRTRSRIVNKWPGQEEAAGDSKVDAIIIRSEHSLNSDDFQIPSLVAYDGSRPIAFGADALEHAGADGVFVAKCFKLQ